MIDFILDNLKTLSMLGVIISVGFLFWRSEVRRSKSERGGSQNHNSTGSPTGGGESCGDYHNDSDSCGSDD